MLWVCLSLQLSLRVGGHPIYRNNLLLSPDAKTKRMTTARVRARARPTMWSPVGVQTLNFRALASNWRPKLVGLRLFFSANHGCKSLIFLAWGARGPGFKSRRPDQSLHRVTNARPSFTRSWSPTWSPNFPFLLWAGCVISTVPSPPNPRHTPRLSVCDWISRLIFRRCRLRLEAVYVYGQQSPLLAQNDMSSAIVHWTQSGNFRSLPSIIRLSERKTM
jgi:hypothetical protein